jgi:hypothetical protein
VRWSLDDLDFPVLVLRDPPVPPALAGLGGGDLYGLVSIGIGYGQGESGSPGLILETLIRRGHRLDPAGGAAWIGTDLTDLASHAIRNLLLGHLAAHVPPPQQRLSGKVEELELRTRHLAAAIPGSPWRLAAADIDGTRFALWLAELDEGFAGVLDCGPVVVAVSGAAVPRDWRLVALSPDAVRAMLGARLRSDQGPAV